MVLSGMLRALKSVSDTAKTVRFSHIIPIVSAGMVVGIITALAQISLAVLIFSGELESFVSNGIGLFLLGSFIATIAVGLLSSYPGMVAPNEDVPAAIMAAIAAGIVGIMSASATPEAMYLTVTAAIIATSLLTGLFFLFQGHFKLGALFRYLPYPVAGGFLAGTGWLLTIGGLSVMAGIPSDLRALPALFQMDGWLRWLPGALFAAALLLISRRFNHSLIMPAMILGAALLFYAVITLLGIAPAEVSREGWLLGPFPKGGLWRPFPLSAVAEVRWSAIIAQAGNILALLLVSTLALLLNSSGLELMVNRSIHLDRELRVNGLGTIASGLAGGLVSYPGLGLSALGYRVGGASRGISLVVAAVLGGVLYAGPNILAWTPKMIFGGLLMYLGLSLLEEWLYNAWFTFSRLDFVIIFSILVVIATAGFLQGVTLGVALAVVLFAVNYSRINVVKHAFSGADYQSRVTRRSAYRRILEEHGAEIRILQLQGFIFFGTANTLFERVRRRIEDSDAPELCFIVLDFRQVMGLDSTATLSFTKMKRLAQAREIALVLTNPPETHALPEQDRSVARFFAQLGKAGQNAPDDPVRIFPDLDRGLEWCENQILLRAGVDPHDDTESLRSQICAIVPDVTQLEGLLPYFERMEVEAGSYLMKQGEQPEALYFIESGQVTTHIEHPDRSPVRLETMRGGRVVGEIGFYLDTPRTASVVVDTPSTIHRLSKQALKQMEREAPDAASALQQGVFRLVSERSFHLINTLNALQSRI